jgi:antitoxin (DNA-binding transcriptional repressor) of toxin-antitoxin stability system
MPTVTDRDLARNTAAVIQDVEFSGRLAPVTRDGKPVAALVPVDKAALEDWLLTHAAEFARAAAAAEPRVCRSCAERRTAEAGGDSPLAAP